jgi:predicted nucleic acid-binding protein
MMQRDAHHAVGVDDATDAHLAALAIEHGAELVSYHRDFGRFQGLRHRLPSAAR